MAQSTHPGGMAFTPDSPESLPTLPSTAASELWDGIVVGGGVSGLSAALALGRSLRRVLVLDTDEPRNRHAEHMHTVLGHEGTPPQVLLRRGRQEAAGYGALFHQARVVQVAESSAEAGHRTMVVTLAGGEQLFARTVIAATGVVDRLPELPGLAERWGRSVLHCPYCHGWEVRHQRLGVLATSPLALHQAELLRQWSDQLTFFSAGAGELKEPIVRRLAARGVIVEPSAVTEVHGEGEAVSAVQLEDGRRIAVDALFTAGRLIPNDHFLSGLRLKRAENPVGSFLEVDQGGRTSHERVWAPGNLSNPMANVPTAISTGTMAGATANMAMVTEDFDLAAG